MQSASVALIWSRIASYRITQPLMQRGAERESCSISSI
jgi:hypothetical protein